MPASTPTDRPPRTAPAPVTIPASSPRGAAAGRRRPSRRARRELHRLAVVLRTETVGGILLVAAAIAALAVANSPGAEWYAELRDRRLGPAFLGLDLSVGAWTADGLLAIFFFLAGLELKHEFVAGRLRDRRQAVVPVLAAVGGMVAPAVVYVIVAGGDDAVRSGWAIPTATDIAFALAVLAVVGRHLPGELRTFLLALAVVDDLLAIIVIAVFFTHEVRLADLAAALVAVAAFGFLVRRARPAGPVRAALLIALAIVAWAFMLRSGVHATVAGVLLGFTVPMKQPRRGRRRHLLADPAVTAQRIDDLWRPVSAGFAVPLFAFFAAGVTVGGLAGLGTALGSRVAIGIVAGLVIGKTIGIFVTALVVGRAVHSPLMTTLAAADWLGIAAVGGVGFTVSLLIGHLAFPGDAAMVADAQVGVVGGSLIAAVLAAAVLGARSRHYRLAAAARRAASRGVPAADAVG